MCIAEGHVLADQRRPRRFTPEQYFKTQAEMAAMFADLPEALANAVEIAQRCNLDDRARQERTCRDFPTPDGVTLDEHLRDEARARARAAARAALSGRRASASAARPRYVERLEFETKTIVQMGFAGYFLIVADFINWAKQQRRAGRARAAARAPARSSRTSLGITDLDPLRYELLFERFLNPERVSMPDFDIDFCQDGRDRVIEYVQRQVRRAESVSQIATFGTMAAKAVGARRRPRARPAATRSATASRS